ncbi:hypothetical protein ACFQE6_02595 [Natrinema soli]|uniref:Secreted glycoprotein n=1 Tax=Natrinema soli TaxID=1930624 RepID=A0ABD5SLN8_9EURY
MNRRQVVQLVALGGLTLPLAGCTNNAAEDNDTADGNGNSTVNEEEEETPDGPEEQKFSGTGPEASNDVSIQGGLIVVDATHEGEDDFEVRLIPENSDAGKVFADSSGTYAGQTARHIDEGTYQLSVVADGGWEVTIKQPRPTSGESPPLSINGTGNEVHGPFEFVGTHQPSGDCDGERISVNVLSPTGDSRAFVFHEDSINNPSAFDYEGVGYIEIKSDGEWSIEIE